MVTILTVRLLVSTTSLCGFLHGIETLTPQHRYSLSPPYSGIDWNFETLNNLLKAIKVTEMVLMCMHDPRGKIWSPAIREDKSVRHPHMWVFASCEAFCCSVWHQKTRITIQDNEISALLFFLRQAFNSHGWSSASALSRMNPEKDFYTQRASKPFSSLTRNPKTIPSTAS